MNADRQTATAERAHCSLRRVIPQSTHRYRSEKSCADRFHPLLLPPRAWPEAPEMPISPSSRKADGNEGGRDSDFPIAGSSVAPNVEFESEFDDRPCGFQR